MANYGWTQGKNAGDITPPRVVYTRANTSFADWKAMLADALVGTDIDPTTLSPLGLLHAWEGDDTPTNYADTLKRRLARKDRIVGPAALG